jgi:5'-deoxynucleotidase YfbR-like HD superfamily hydrolase
MNKLLKRAAIWYARNYRLNTPEKIFKHLAKYYFDYSPHLCNALFSLYAKNCIKEKVFFKTRNKLWYYLENYSYEFAGKRTFDSFWENPYDVKTIENKKKFLRFIAEKEGGKK